VDVLRFVQAISDQPQGRPRMLFEEIQELLQETLVSPEFAAQIAAAVENGSSPAVGDRVLGLLSGAVEKAGKEILDQGFLSVDVSELLGRQGEVWQFPFADFQKTADFLDQLWSGLYREIELPAFTYGDRWLLRNEETGQALRDLGSHWARNRGYTRTRDTRPLAMAGLKPGMKLKAQWARKW